MRTFFKLLNTVIKPLLDSPLHVLLSYRFMLLAFNGRKSGKRYVIPVEYVRDGNTVYVMTPRGRTWWKNLLGGVPVDVKLKGKWYHGTGTAISDDPQALRAGVQKLFTFMSDKRATSVGENLVLVTITLETMPQPA